LPCLCIPQFNVNCFVRVPSEVYEMMVFVIEIEAGGNLPDERERGSFLSIASKYCRPQQAYPAARA
jgi:hypothetical protein